MKRKVTIRDVATAATVSHQTVSRTVNDRADVSKETQSRVWRIKDLNCQPSTIAHSLIRRRSDTFGVGIAGLKHIGPSQTLNGTTEKAAEMGDTLAEATRLPPF